MVSKETLAAREQLNQDFKLLLKDAQGLLDSTKGDLEGKAAEARERLEKNLDEMKGKYKELEGKVSDTAEATERLIREYPYHSLGISFGVGLVLGLFLGKK